jgi:hypothetical protein
MDIEQAINIGPKPGADLRKAGIDSLETLQQSGLAQAWSLLQSVAPKRNFAHACSLLGRGYRAVEG